MAQILVDTSAVYALLDAGDTNHRTARTRLHALRKRRATPLLTNFIVAESHALLLARIGPEAARSWLLSNVWPVERVSAEDELDARRILTRHSDKSYSYTDATSFAVMERSGIRTAFAFDHHFQQYGFDLFTR